MDYGIVGNCKTAALISKEGSVEWCCFPRFDSPSAFAKILDKRIGGSFGIKPVGNYRIKQQYIKNTNVLETIFYNKRDRFKIIDFFPRFKEREKVSKENLLCRIVKRTKGTPKIRIVYDPKLDYAQGKTTLKISKGRLIAKNKSHMLFLYSNLDLKKIIERRPVEVKDGLYFVVHAEDEQCIGHDYDIDSRLERTVGYWHDFVNSATWPAQYKNQTIRSALALKLLTYDNSGAVVAAATTSLPEEVGKNKNWDYRYCWLRDSSLTINALTRISHFDEALTYMQFLRERVFSRVAGLRMQVMYGVEGERELTERSLEHLNGYKNSRPVRIGNAAYKQKQIDVAGEVIDAIHRFYVYHRYVDTIDPDLWELVVHMVDYIIKEWKGKDHSIWELRQETKHFTFSKVLSWAALNKAIEMAKFFSIKADLKRWSKERDRIKKDIHKKAFNEKKQAFTMYYGADELDASLLLMPYYGFINPKDEKMKKTIEAIEKELSRNSLLLRFNYKKDIGYLKNAFLVCSFWLVIALYSSGQKRKARRYFKKLLGYSNHLGLYSECINPKTKELLGNFPQAYTHIELINSAVLLQNGKH